MWPGALNTSPSLSSPLNLYLLVSWEALWYGYRWGELQHRQNEIFFELCQKQSLFISWELPIRIFEPPNIDLSLDTCIGFSMFWKHKIKSYLLQFQPNLYYQVMCPMLLLIYENTAHFMKTSMPHHLQFLGILFRYSNQDGHLEQISLKMLLDTEYRQPSKESIIDP